MVYGKGLRSRLWTLVHFAGVHPPTGEHVMVPGATEAELRSTLLVLHRLTRLPRFAHHPACNYWNNHIIRIGKHPLCLGCTAMYTGLLTGVGFLTFGGMLAMDPSLRFSLSLFLYSPTVVQVHYQKYWFKALARFLLGIAVALALSASSHGYYWNSIYAVLNIAFLATFIGLYIGTKRYRQRRLDVPCLRCPEGRFPFCGWRRELMAETLRAHESGRHRLPLSFAAFLLVANAQASTLTSTTLPAQGFVGRGGGRRRE
jgi:hypothetical protein